MTYGNDKIKDMVESLLPSTRRRWAREERRSINRNARRNARVRPDDYDVIERKRRIHISEMVSERRQGDKLSMLRWAVKVTEHLDDPAERLAYIAALMPANVIGEHAMTHVVSLPEFDVEERRYGRGYLYAYIEKRQREREQHKQLWTERRAKLATIIESGKQVQFNRVIKASFHPARWRNNHYINAEGKPTYFYKAGAINVGEWVSGHRSYNAKTREYETSPCDCTPRVLRGLHDVDSFCDEMFNGKFRHTETRDAVIAYLEGK